MTDNERREMEQMRRDAERRVRDMNARAKAVVSGSENRNHPQKNEQPDRCQEPEKPSQNRGLGLLKMLNLQSLKLDNDVLVIIMMIMLLGSDDADELLLLALVYIMW